MAANDELHDSGLDWGVTNGTTLSICSSDPGLTWGSIAAAELGQKTGITCTVVNGATDGRALQVPQITDGAVSADGTATHWVLHNDTDTVVATGPITPNKAVSNGGTFTNPATIVFTHRDPA